MADTSDAEPLTYWRDIQPIVADRCVSCYVEGGIAPFVLDTYAAVSSFAPVLAQAIEAGEMPPWPPGEDYVETRVSPAAYDALVRHILATLAMDAEGRPRRIAGSGYHGNDGFYEARGRYSPFVTCNEWVRRGLAEAGIRFRDLSTTQSSLEDIFVKLVRDGS